MFAKLKNIGDFSRLHIRTPEPQAGRAGLAIALIVRNEARHIGEWARFHLVAGVDHFIVYDDANTDGTIEVLREEIPTAQLTVMPWAQRLRVRPKWREVHNQVLAYAHAISNFGPRYRWMALIDADEFMVPKQGTTLAEALAHLGDQPNISLPWHNFGRNGHMTPPAGGQLSNYLRRVADPVADLRGVRNFKTVVDPCRVTSVSVHATKTDGNDATSNDRGDVTQMDKRGERAFYSADFIQLNHYYARSEQELAEKIARGSNRRVDKARHEARVRRNLANIEAEEVEDRAVLAYVERCGKSDWKV